MMETLATRRTPTLLGLACLASIALSPERAYADEKPAPMRLVYTSSSSCPSGDAFLSDVLRVNPGVRAASAAVRARVFLVSFDPPGADGSVRAGHLRIEEDGSFLGARNVYGATCAEVAQLLSFAVALAYDPASSTGAAAAPPPILPPAPPPPLPPPVEPAPTLPLVAPATPPVAISSGASSRWSLAVHGSVASDMSPNPAFGAGMSAEVAWPLRSFHPWARLAVEYATSDPASAAGGAVIDFRSALGTLEGCVSPWSFASSRLTFGGCLRLDAGARIVTGDNVPNGLTVVRPWVALGPALHVRLGLTRDAGWFLDLSGNAFVPVEQENVGLTGVKASVYDVGVLGFRGELGVGVRFR